jgi:FtsZ-binding cell division protein ZapB
MNEIKPVYEARQYIETVYGISESAWQEISFDAYQACQLTPLTMQTRIRYSASDYEALQKEVVHWKANHADLKERLHVATHRTDLPSDRLPSFDKMKAEIAELQKENAELRSTISNLTKAYERESNDCLKTLEERDYWYDKADSLTDKISECFDVTVGEHSNANCPFDEANKILEGAYVTKFDREFAALSKRIAELEMMNREVK